MLILLFDFIMLRISARVGAAEDLIFEMLICAGTDLVYITSNIIWF